MTSLSEGHHIFWFEMYHMQNYYYHCQGLHTYERSRQDIYWETEKEEITLVSKPTQ